MVQAVHVIATMAHRALIGAIVLGVTFGAIAAWTAVMVLVADRTGR